MFNTSLNQTVTYWAPSGSDLYSQATFSAPETRKARWEDRAELIRSKAGQEYTTKSRVFMAEDFDLDGYLFLGESDDTNPLNVTGAYEIQQKSSIPDLRGLSKIYTAFL